MKEHRGLIRIIVAVFILMFVIGLIPIFTKEAEFALYGYGVDRDGVLYFGKRNGIDKIKEGLVIDTIPNQSVHGYIFSIVPNNYIELYSSEDLLKMDLDGNIISITKSNPNSGRAEENITKLYLGADGNNYVLEKNLFIPYSIYRVKGSQKEIIYQTNTLAILTRVVFFTSMLLFFTLVLILVVKKILF